MSTIVIKISELRGKDEENVKDLAEFLEGRADATVDVTSDDVTLKYEEGKKGPSRSYLRVLLRKFLHKAELKEEFRVISGKENVFIIKERKE
ncbi:MAG: 60S ribosomal protein L22 [Candidatus Bathyarchaeota archaeon]|nr:60S ribosomal protein L22 [Candidatus Bathyarchaeota archaeon]MDH4292425.1 60S ribosomal protein L22 [Dehalococcoidia bacterium]MDH5701801.1 60S ribosomal protein L22 [Candidatus Bathyarchaeota archaeon]